MRNDDGTTPLADPLCWPWDEHFDLEVDVHDPAQRRRHPQSVVGERARVETDHQLDLAEVVLQIVEVGLEVRAAALLAGLDQDDAAAVGDVVGLHRLDGEQRGEGGVAVVADAAREEAIVAANRLVRSEAVGPVAERRLLVEVSVEDGGAVARGRRGDGDDQDRRAIFEPVDLDVEVGEGPRERPVREQFDGAVDVAVAGPTRCRSSARDRGWWRRW